MELGERIAVLEHQIVEINLANDKQDAHLIKIEAKIDEINQRLDKQKGFFGGVVFVVSALATAIAIAVTYFTGRHGV